MWATRSLAMDSLREPCDKSETRVAVWTYMKCFVEYRISCNLLWKGAMKNFKTISRRTKFPYHPSEIFPKQIRSNLNFRIADKSLVSFDPSFQLRIKINKKKYWSTLNEFLLTEQVLTVSLRKITQEISVSLKLLV